MRSFFREIYRWLVYYRHDIYIPVKPGWSDENNEKL